MSNEKKTGSMLKNPIPWIFRTSMLVLGAVISLNIAVAFLKPILPWLAGGAGLVATIGAVIAIVRWRKARW